MAVNSWENIFVGREEELNALREALCKSAPALFGDNEADPEPQVVVLKGEPGVGKSRIVQEFYRRIAVAPDEGGLDPDDYWPDAFGDSAKSGITELVNPVIEEEHTLKKTPPFIWWGVKWNTPISGRNGDQPQLGEQHNLKHLIAHKAGIQRRIENVMKVAKVGLKTAISQLSFGWLDAGLLFDAADSVGSVTTVKRAARNITSGHDAALSMQEQDDDQLSKVQKYLQKIIHPPGVGKIRDAGTPLVLWLDDVQWMLPDEVNTILELLNPASSSHWPLLIVATYRSSDWNRHNSETISQDNYFASGIPEEFQTIVEVEKKLDFTKPLHVAMPGLTPKQNSLILEKTQGVPVVFRLAVTALLDDPYSFVNGDTSEQLTEDAEDKLQGIQKKVAMSYFFAQKMKHLDPMTERVLKWSSCQGNRFLQQVTQSIAKKKDLKDCEVVVAKAIDISINPEAIVQRAGTENQNEFRLEIYRTLLLETFDTPKEKREILDAVRQIVEEWIEDEDRFNQLRQDEKLDILLLAEEHLSPCEDGEVLDTKSLDLSNRALRLWIKSKIQRIALTHDSSISLDLAREVVTIDQQVPEGIPRNILGISSATEVLQEFSWYSGKVAESMDAVSHFTQRFIFDKTKDAFEEFSQFYLVIATIKSNAGLLQEALEDIVLAIELIDSCIAESKDMALHLECKTDCCMRKLLIEWQLDQRDLARQSCIQCIEIIDQAIDKFGSTANQLSNKTLCFANMAMIACEQGLDAGHTFAQARKLLKQLIDEYGISECRLGFKAILAGNVALHHVLAGEYDDALREFSAAVELHNQQIDQYGEDPDLLASKSRALSNFAQFYMELGTPDKSPPLLTEAVEIIDRVIDEYGYSPERLGMKALILYNFSCIYHLLGEHGKAKLMLTDAMALINQNLEENGVSGDRLMAKLRIQNLCGLFGCDTDEDRWNVYAEAIETADQIILLFSDIIEVYDLKALVLINIANEAITMGRIDDARLANKEGLELTNQMIDRCGVTPRRLKNRCNCYATKAKLKLIEQQVDDAVAAYSAAIETINQAIDEYGITSEFVGIKAEICIWAGDLLDHYDDKKAMYVTAIEALNQVDEYGSEAIIRSHVLYHWYMGDAEVEAGEYDDARIAYTTALEKEDDYIKYGSLDSLLFKADMLFDLARLDTIEEKYDDAKLRISHSIEALNQAAAVHGEIPAITERRAPLEETLTDPKKYFDEQKELEEAENANISEVESNNSLFCAEDDKTSTWQKLKMKLFSK